MSLSMSSISVRIAGGTSLLPAEIMGYTYARKRTVVAYDHEQTTFIFEDGCVLLRSEYDFDDVLFHPPKMPLVCAPQ